MKSKKCTKCCQNKSFDNFIKNPSYNDGFTYYCKNCLREQKKKIRNSDQKKYNSYGLMYKKTTINGFLCTLYRAMTDRVKGKTDERHKKYYKGKSIMSREVFYNWAKNHPDFLKLFKRWTMCDYDRKFTPSINRINSNKGYDLDNVEWMTFSQNCSLAGEVRSINKRKAVYALLGDKNV